MLDDATGQLVERRLGHQNGEANSFYRNLSKPVCVGIEATGSDGLAEIGEADVLDGILPKLETVEAREVANEYLELSAKHESTRRNVVNEWEKNGKEAFPTILQRKNRLR